MKLSAKEQLKLLLLKENMTIANLAKELSNYTGKKYTRQSISSKMYKGTLRYDEIMTIIDILGYEVDFKKATER